MTFEIPRTSRHGEGFWGDLSGPSNRDLRQYSCDTPPKAPKSAEGRLELRYSPQTPPPNSRAAKRGGFQTGGFPDLDLSFLFCPFWDFPDFSGIFPICSGMVQGFSRFVLFLFLGLLRAPTRNSPERVRDTIWTFPEKVGNTRVWKPPGLASLN